MGLVPPAPLVPVRPFVVDLLREAGRDVGTSAPLHVEDHGGRLVVDQQDGTFAVLRTDDMGTDVRLLTHDARIVETFLVTDVADDWRRTHARRRLGDRRLRRPRSHRVVGQGDGMSAVHRVDGSPVAWHLLPADARRLAAALDHPVETVVAAVKEKNGRPVWTGSVLAPLIGSLVVTLLVVGVKAYSVLRDGTGSSEAVIGISLGLLISLVGGVGYVVHMKRGRRLTGAVLDRDRPLSPRWRCLSGPSFATAVAGLGVRRRLPTRSQLELTLVEAPTGLEVWRGGGPEPLVHVPWADVESVDCEPVAGADTAVLVVRTRAGGRVPLVLLRERTGGQRGATAATTEQYAAHLRDLATAWGRK